MVWGEIRSNRGRSVLLLVLILSMLLRLWIVWQPVSTLVEKNLPDDAYYYFVLARNSTQIGSVSMDGINPTNGFHPLWWLILLPVFAFPAELSDAQVHIALTMGSILDLIAIFLIAQIGAVVSKSETRGLVAAVLYAFNPMVFLQTTNGLETALSMALLVAFWYLTVKWIDGHFHAWRAVAIGFLAGLLFLARSDSLFFIALTFSASFLFLGPKNAWKPLLTAAIVTGLTILPWLVWSKINVGSWLQESGVAVPHANYVRLSLQSGSGLGPALQEAARQLTFPNLWLRGDPTGLPLLMGIGLWMVLLAALGARWARDFDRFEVYSLLPILLAGVTMLIFHAGIRWYPRPWYFVPNAAAFAVGFALIIRSDRGMERRIALIPGLILLGFILSGMVIWRAGFYPWQREMLQAAHWIVKNLPDSKKMGSFNSGFYSYYWDGIVVNLDGVVNHTAFESIREKRELCYMVEEELDFLMDYDSAIHREYSPFMGEGYPELLIETEILGGDSSGPLGALRLYRIDRIKSIEFCGDSS